MNNIGKRIKELRKKNDLTQEKLADFLGVTYKSVSKWECGITTPDISMIGPLTKILNVSSDELLGLNPESIDKRRAELEEELHQAWINGGELDGFELVYKALEKIVREYPGDMKILCDFAYAVSNRALHLENREEEIQKAIRHFETVIENTEDENVKLSAINGITQSLSFIGRYEEARNYADLVPDRPRISKDAIIENCLRGEELRKRRQQRLDSFFHQLLTLMEECADDKLRAIEDCEKILQIIIPDGEYLEYHCNLADLTYKKARLLMRQNKYIEAVEALEKYKYHSVLADRADVHENELRYTSMYLDLIVLPPNVPQEKITPSYSEAFELQIQDELFEPLYDREDFKNLFK